jgi:formate/nitrite transporter
MNDSSSEPVELLSPQVITFDPIMPADMAVRAERAGVLRASSDLLTCLVLSLLAGAFISFGAVFATTVSAGHIAISPADGTAFSAALPYGVVRLLTGLAFALGVILVVIAGAELFTGNILIVMAWASGKVTTRALLRNWTIVFAGNFAGALLTAALMFVSTQYTFGDGAVGLVALKTANATASLAFVPALTLGILCNALVCLAVWMVYSAQTTVGKIFAVAPPVVAFAAAGFEHSIANIYFIPLALFIKAGAADSFWTSIGMTAADFPALTWGNFLLGNLLPVTIGNIIGGAGMVAATYWFVYLRKSTTVSAHRRRAGKPNGTGRNSISPAGRLGV